MAATANRAACVTMILVAVLALAGGPYAGTAYACSCAGGALADEVESSDAVFSGEVQSIDEGVTPDGEREGTVLVLGGIEARGKVSFAVRDSWKGVATETVEIYGQGDGVNCYNTFEEGEAYLVYASRGEGMGESAPLENNACGATKPLADANADLRLLGSPTDSLPETGGVPSPGSVAQNTTSTYGALTVVFALAAGVLLVGRAARGR